MALRDPFPADLDLVQPVEHLMRATVWPVGAPAFGLTIVSAPKLSYSLTWSPYVQASFTAAMPLDPVQRAQLDPRAKVYVHLDLGYRTASRRFLPNMAQLRLSKADPNPDGTVDVVVLGMEATAQEAAWTRDWDFSLPRTGIVECLTDLIRSGTIGFQRSVVSSLPNGYRRDLLADTEQPLVSDGANIWSSIDSLAAQANLKVWEDGLKVWHIEPRRQFSAAPALLLADGPGGLVTEWEPVRSRDNWYNEVRLTFPDAPRDPHFPDREVRGIAQTRGKYSPTLVGSVTYAADRPGWANYNSAAAAATALMATFEARTYRFKVEAVAAYWLRPGMLVDLDLGGVRSRQLVESVDFRPWEGLMDLETSIDEYND